MSEDEAASAPDAREQIPPALRGLRVLVVAGSEEDRRSLGALLRSLGMEPTLMAQARPAVEELRRATRQGRPYGLLLIDPTLRGSTALRARRAQDDPLLAITPRLEMAPGASRDEAPAEYGPPLPRPVTRAALLDAIRHTLGPRAPAPARRPAAPAPTVSTTVVLGLDPVSAVLACRLVELTSSAPIVVDTLEEALAAVDTADAVVLDPTGPDADAHAERLRRARPALRVLGLDELAASHEASAPPPERTASPAFDRAALVGRLGGDPHAAERVLERFLEGADGYLGDLASASESSDADAICRQAHRIKGALSWIGAERAAGVAGDLERLCRGGETERIPALCQTLQLEIQRVVAAVRARASPEGD